MTNILINHYYHQGIFLTPVEKKRNSYYFAKHYFDGNSITRNTNNEVSENNLIKYFISGGFGGMCCVLTGHPMDTVKVRLQTMPSTKHGTALYSGTVDCMKQIVIKEGIRGLYKGMGITLLTVAPFTAISFWSYALGQHLFQNDPCKATPIELFTAGAFSGFFTILVVVPTERIKCLLQIQRGRSPLIYNGMFDCAKQLYYEGGIKSLYRGTAITVIRDVPSSGMYFMTYEWLKEVFEETSCRMKCATLLAGGCAGIANWAVCMPADVLKSRIQTAPEGTYSNGMIGALKQLIKLDGPTALFKGITPVMLRAFPSHAACFWGFERAMYFLDEIL